MAESEQWEEGREGAVGDRHNKGSIWTERECSTHPSRRLWFTPAVGGVVSV